MIKVTFEFPTIDAAIVAMGKMVGAPAKSASVEAPQAAQAPSAPATRSRKPRNDAGKPRGPYKEPPVQEPAAPAAAAPSAPAPVVPEPAASPAAGAGAVPSAEDAQEIFAKVFDAKGIVRAKELLQRYGVGRVRELLEGQRTDFIAECNELLNETNKVAA